MSADCGHEDWMLLPAYRAMTEDRVPTTKALAAAIHGAMCDVSHHDSQTVCKNQRRYEMVAKSVRARLIPDHVFSPVCPCRGCHLEAQAEDATWR